MDGCPTNIFPSAVAKKRQNSFLDIPHRGWVALGFHSSAVAGSVLLSLAEGGGKDCFPFFFFFFEMSRHLSLLQCWYCSWSPRSRDKNRNYSLTLSRGYFENIISHHFLEHHRVSAASVYLKRRAISVLTGAKILEGILPSVLQLLWFTVAL